MPPPKRLLLKRDPPALHLLSPTAPKTKRKQKQLPQPGKETTRVSAKIPSKRRIRSNKKQKRLKKRRRRKRSKIRRKPMRKRELMIKRLKKKEKLRRKRKKRNPRLRQR